MPRHWSDAETRFHVEVARRLGVSVSSEWAILLLLLYYYFFFLRPLLFVVIITLQLQIVLQFHIMRFSRTIQSHAALARHTIMIGHSGTGLHYFVALNSACMWIGSHPPPLRQISAGFVEAHLPERLPAPAAVSHGLCLAAAFFR